MILPFIYSSLDECVALPLRLIAVSHAQSGEIRPLPRPPASPMYVFGFKLRTLTDVSESTMCRERPDPAGGWASPRPAEAFRSGGARRLPKHIYYAASPGCLGSICLCGVTVYVSTRVILGQSSLEEHMGTRVGCTGAVFQQNKTHKNCPWMHILATFYAKLSLCTENNLGDHFFLAIYTVKFLCHHPDWPRDIREPPGFKN